MEKTEILQQIEEEVKSNKILMYVKGTPEAPQCGFSQATMQLFANIGKPFKTVDILANPDRRSHVPEYSQWPTFPQIFIDGKLIGGCDIVHEMHEQGQLVPLIEKAFKSE